MVALQRHLHQCEESLLYAIQRGQTLMKFAVDPDARQRHTAKSRQHHLRGRLRRLPTGLPRRDACERRASFLQMAPHNALHQHQHAPRDAQQTAQPNDAMFVRQKQRHQRPGAPLQPPEALRNQVRATLRRDTLGQTHLLGGMIGRIHAPTETPHRLGERRLRVCRPHPYALAAHGGRWARAVATFDVRADVGPHGDRHQPLNAMFG